LRADARRGSAAALAASGAALTGGVPGDLSVRAPAAAAAAAAAARCRDLDSLGGGGGPCSGVLRHASHLQCSPQLTPACAPAQAQSSCTERAPEAVCRVNTRVAAGRALDAARAIRM